MHTEKIVPITTRLGILAGRDAIALKKLEKTDDRLTFAGEIWHNGLSEYEDEDDKPFALVFEGVVYFSACELDTYTKMEGTPLHPAYESAFDKVENSTLLDALPIRSDYPKSDYQHFILATYDEIFNIVAKSYQLNIRR